MLHMNWGSLEETHFCLVAPTDAQALTFTIALPPGHKLMGKALVASFLNWALSE